jgi:PAT family beta-lactamase induction signal transducer AmpG
LTGLRRSAAAASHEPPGWREAAAVYLDGRVIAVGFLGFSSGLPLLLTFSTLSVWLAELGVSLTAIGLFALVGLPYSLKFAWAPLIDRLPLPLLTTRFGRRRGWALATQALLIVAIVGLGGSDPAGQPFATAAWAVLLTFASASQDVVIDAYRVEILPERQQGAGAAMIVAGYRIGMLAAGAGALFLAEVLPWPAVYGAMAALVGVGVLTVLLMPEPDAAPVPPGTGLLHWLRHAVLEPFLDFLQRQNWWLILGFIVLYKFGDSLAGVMANVFYIQIGFSKAEIASVSKIFGLVATLAGGFLGGLLVARAGIWWSLLWAGILQALSNLLFAVQAVVGADLGMLTLTIAVENLSGGMGTAAFVAYLSGLCNVAYTATQYALLSSFMALARTTLSSGGGGLAEETGWVVFFVLTTLAALPGLALLFWLPREGKGGPP